MGTKDNSNLDKIFKNEDNKKSYYKKRQSNIGKSYS